MELENRVASGRCCMELSPVATRVAPSLTNSCADRSGEKSGHAAAARGQHSSQEEQAIVVPWPTTFIRSWHPFPPNSGTYRHLSASIQLGLYALFPSTLQNFAVLALVDFGSCLYAFLTGSDCSTKTSVLGRSSDRVSKLSPASHR